MAAGSYENFNVGSRFIKRRLRPHFYSVYAFCRLVDDLGDEVEGDRLELLDRWEDELHLCYSGSPKLIWFQALQGTIDEFDIPPEPFLRLIEANRRDQRDKEYADFDALVEYCTYSATPVGHLVLYLYGYFSDEMSSYSDDTCIALQLANFWQDVARDHGKGRIYIPISDMDEFGVELSTIRKREPTARISAVDEIPSRSDQGIIPHWLPTPRSFAARFPSRIFGDHCGWFVSPRRDRGVGLRHVDGSTNGFKIYEGSDHAEDHRTQPNRHDTGSNECVCQSFSSVSGCSLLNIRCRNQPTIRLNPRIESARR